MAAPVVDPEVSSKGTGEGNNSILGAELGREKMPPASQNYGEAPDGGTRAWLVAAGGSSIFFACLGFSNAFGTFQEYYLTHQLRGESPTDIAWIGSLAAFLQFASGMLGGPLFDRFGARVCHLRLLTLT